MKKLPIIRITPLTKREDDTTSRRLALNKKVAALRKATGKKEACTLSCVCARTGQHFSVIFERFTENHRFQVSRIEKHEKSTAKKGSLFGGLLAKSMPEVKDFDASEFDFSGWVCAYCGSDHRVHCGSCGYAVCGDRIHVLPDGKKIHACHDACGNTGMLVRLERISATSGAFGQGKMGSIDNNKNTKLLSQGQRPRLKGPDPLRLDRPR